MKNLRFMDQKSKTEEKFFFEFNQTSGSTNSKICFVKFSENI